VIGTDDCSACALVNNRQRNSMAEVIPVSNLH